MCKSLMQKVINAIFSIETDKNHKVFKVLCFKFKFKQNYICGTVFSKLLSFFGMKIYDIKGANNKIIVVENGNERELGLFETIKGLNVIIYGSNNIIKIHKPFQAENSTLRIGDYPNLHNDHAYIELYSTTLFRQNYVIVAYGKEQRLVIEKDTTMYNCSINLAEDSQIHIGKDCMFAGRSNIYGAEGHTIFDEESKRILNVNSVRVHIGNHCWIGQNCLILKNGYIPDISIVGANSVVTKSFEHEKSGGCVIAGSPAILKKRGVNWARKSPSYYLENNISPAEDCLV